MLREVLLLLVYCLVKMGISLGLSPPLPVYLNLNNKHLYAVVSLPKIIKKKLFL